PQPDRDRGRESREERRENGHRLRRAGDGDPAARPGGQGLKRGMAQIILDRLAAQFRGGEIVQTGSQHGNEWARIRRDAWTKVATFLRDDPATKLEMFIDLTCVDRFSTEPRFDVVLHLYSVSLKHRVRLYGGVPENDPTIDTL